MLPQDFQEEQVTGKYVKRIVDKPNHLEAIVHKLDMMRAKRHNLDILRRSAEIVATDAEWVATRIEEAPG